MIVRDRPSGWRLFLILRGSILKQIRWVLLANILVDIRLPRICAALLIGAALFWMLRAGGVQWV